MRLVVIADLKFPNEWECDNESALLDQLEECARKINETFDPEPQFKMIRSWCHCVERLIGLGHKTASRHGFCPA